MALQLLWRTWDKFLCLRCFRTNKIDQLHNSIQNKNKDMQQCTIRSCRLCVYHLFFCVNRKQQRRLIFHLLLERKKQKKWTRKMYTVHFIFISLFSYFLAMPHLLRAWAGQRVTWQHSAQSIVCACQRCRKSDAHREGHGGGENYQNILGRMFCQNAAHNNMRKRGMVQRQNDPKWNE